MRRLYSHKFAHAYRVRRAIEGGWLLNRETRKGHAARLTSGADIPDPTTGLPSETQVRELFDRSNRFGDLDTPSPPADRPDRPGPASTSSFASDEGVDGLF